MEEETTQGAKDELIPRARVLKLLNYLLKKNIKHRRKCDLLDEEIWEESKRRAEENRNCAAIIKSLAKRADELEKESRKFEQIYRDYKTQRDTILGFIITFGLIAFYALYEELFVLIFGILVTALLVVGLTYYTYTKYFKKKKKV